MMNQDQIFVKQVLISQIHNIEAGLLSAYPNNSFKDKLETGPRYDRKGNAAAFLSYHPNSDVCMESIDLTFSLVCDQQKAVFCSEI